MRFEENKLIEKIGAMAGFVFSYILFTTILFGIFLFLEKSHGISYLYVVGITLSISIAGIIIKRLLQ